MTDRHLTPEEQAFLAETGLVPDLLEPLTDGAPPLPAEVRARILERVRQKAGLTGGGSPPPPAPAFSASRAGDAPRSSPRRWWLVAAAALLVLGGAAIISNPQAAMAAIQRLVRLVPGIGLVETETGTLVLPSPVSVEKDGQRLTVTGLVSNAAGTEVRFLVEGLPEAKFHPSTRPDRPEIRLPDGTVLRSRGGSTAGGAGTATGAFWFEPLPRGTNELTLILPSTPGSQPLEIALSLVDAASAGLTEARAGNWSEERLGVRVGVPHWAVQGDRIVLALDALTPEGMAADEFGEAMEGGDELVLTDDQGRVYPLLRQESKLLFVGDGSASAVLQGPLPAGVRRLRLQAPVLRVTEHAQIGFRIPLGDLPAGEPVAVDRRLELGSRSFTIRTVTRLDEKSFRFVLDLGPVQDGAQLVGLRLRPEIEPSQKGIMSWSGSQLAEGQFLTIEYAPEEPPEGELKVIFHSPQIVLYGGWEVDLPVESE